MLMEELTSAEVILIGVDVRRRHLLDRLLFIFSQNNSKGGDDARRDLILNRKHILQLTVVTLGPKLRAVSGTDELRVEAKALAGFSDASLENRRNLKLASDLADVVVLAFERERRGA